MNKAQKFIYWLDRKTKLFEKLETSRANWFENHFISSSWFNKNSKIIDIGSGVGDITKKMLNYSTGLVVGIDIEDFRRIGNKIYQGFYFCISDANKIPFKENSFDCVTALWTLHHISNPIIAIGEMNRVLKKGGTLIIIEDLVDDSKGFKGFFTRVYDKVINLEFSSHPHSNKSLNQWDSIFQNKFHFKPIELKEIPWFTKFKLLKFGLLRYQK